MRNLSVVTVVLAAVLSAAPAFAHSHNRPRHAAEGAFGAIETPHFVRVGPNGYWITSTWGCYTDDGQWRIQDCESATGGGGS
jgi:hypothetical protein